MVEKASLREWDLKGTLKIVRMRRKFWISGRDVGKGRQMTMSKSILFQVKY